MTSEKGSVKKKNQQRQRKPLMALLMENDPAYVRLFKKNCAGPGDIKLTLTCSVNLTDGMTRLQESKFDVILIDPFLPDSRGIDSFISIHKHSPDIPIILLLGPEDEELAVTALQSGAQDCVLREELGTEGILRSVRYAIERHRRMTDMETLRQREHRLAYFDSLTELPNRQLFNDRLNQALSHAQRYDERLAVLFIDLDGFKAVNDSLGHESGDLLLKAAAGRLRACLRRSDTVARVGGDEFTCILTNIQKPKDIAVVAQKIIRALSSPFDIVGSRVYISGSIGASIYPDDAEDLRALIRNADTAMYHAKKQGKNNFQFYASSENSIIPHLLSSGRSAKNAPEQKAPALL